MTRGKLLVCDLDNTLYDWVAFFVPSFYAMVDTAVQLLGCDREALLDDLKRVHQKYHDSEHPFALLETKTVESSLATLSINARREFLDPAFKAFNSKRKETLHLYPGVEETLKELQLGGIRLVAHSESRVYSVMFRMKFLNIVQFFERIYCLERPEATLADQSKARQFWDDFPTEKITEVAHHRRKPNPKVLREILDDFKLNEGEAAYIGDSLVKDVFMAKETGCYAIWAKYGTNHDPVQYEKLVRVSHWTPEEVANEAKWSEIAKGVRADFIANRSFAEVVECVV